MSPAVTVENLSKHYRIGAPRESYKTIRESLAGVWQRGLRGAARRSDTAANDGSSFWALKDVSFQIQPGEVVGIIGRNGAGKSTLLKILSRITEPTSGKARIRGRVASLLEVGTGFHPELTGRENIYLNGSILGMSKREIRRRFDEIVAFAEIDRFLDTPVKRYSSGMYVRLAFAVAAHLEPEILIIDEVLAVGDAEFQKKCLGKMRSVATTGRTVLFVSHNTRAIQSLCQRAVLLNNGTLRADGPALVVTRRYLESSRENTLIPVRHYSPPTQQTKARILSVSLKTIDGIPSATFSTGQSIGIDIAYQFADDNQCPRIGIVIESDNGVAVCWLSNRRVDMQPPKCRDGVIRLVVEDVRLMPGIYNLNLYFGNDQKDLQVEQNAISFSIIEDDTLGSGRLPSAVTAGHINICAAWTYEIASI